MAYTSEQIKQINQQFKDNLTSGDPMLVKQAGLAGTTYFRTRIRENAVYRKLLPPVSVTADNFDVNEFSDLPSMIVELDFDSEGAMQVPFETGTIGATMNGRKIRCEFGRVMTPQYQIDKIRLTGYKMPLLDIMYDYMLKDIMDVEDEAWTDVNQAIVGNADDQTAQINEFGIRRCVRQIFDRDGFVEIRKGMLRTKGKLKPSKMLMNELLYSDLAKLDRTAIGGDAAQDMLFDGTTTTKLNGMDVLVTSKDTVCAEKDVWVFTDPDFYGKFYTYEDVNMITEEKDNIWIRFFAHETIGGVVANRAGVCKITFDAENINEVTNWTDGLDSSNSVKP